MRITIRQLFNRLVFPIDYYYYKRLLKMADKDGVPLHLAKDMYMLMEKYGVK